MCQHALARSGLDDGERRSKTAIFDSLSLSPRACLVRGETNDIGFVVRVGALARGGLRRCFRRHGAWLARGFSARTARTRESRSHQTHARRVQGERETHGWGGGRDLFDDKENRGTRARRETSDEKRETGAGGGGGKRDTQATRRPRKAARGKISRLPFTNSFSFVFSLSICCDSARIEERRRKILSLFCHRFIEPPSSSLL